MAIDHDDMTRIEPTSAAALLSDEEAYDVLLRQQHILLASVAPGFMARHQDLFGGLLRTHKEDRGTVVGVERPGAFGMWVSSQRRAEVGRSEAFELHAACVAYDQGQTPSVEMQARMLDLGLVEVCEALKVVRRVAGERSDFSDVSDTLAAKLYVSLDEDQVKESLGASRESERVSRRRRRRR